MNLRWVLRALRAERRAVDAERRAVIAEKLVVIAIKKLSDADLVAIKNEIRGGADGGAGRT